MKKLPLTPSQLYWLGKLTGHYVDNDGKCVGSRGYAKITVNPGRTDGNERTLETLHRKGFVVWINTYGTNIKAGNGFTLTKAGLEQWLKHNPNRPLCTAGHGGIIEPQPTPEQPGESPTYIPKPRIKRNFLPSLTLEEWQHLANLFDGANDPLSISIAEKAKRHIALAN